MIATTRRTVLIGLLGAAALLLGGCIVIAQQPLKERTQQITVANQADSPVRVSTENGRITVKEGGTDTVTVTAVLRAETDERLEAATVSAERRPDGSLSISVTWPEGKRRSNEGCSFDVTIPSANGVTLESSNGAIELTGLEGVADLKTSNGKVTVTGHDGSVTAVTSNGSVSVADAGGDVTIDTSNGAVTVENAPGVVSVRTSNGSATVSLAERSAGPVQVRSSNGRVKVRLSSAFVGTLSATTSNGQVTKAGLSAAKVLSVSKSAMVIQVGEGKATSTIQTSNGPVEIAGP